MPADSLKRKQVVGLEQLDELLDVPVCRFDAVVARLVRTCRSKDISFRMTRPATLDAGSTPHPRSSWSRLYEAEVGRLPRMDRAEEFADRILRSGA